MAYEKQTWVTGETITAEKLNHMEDGIEASSSRGSMVLHYDTEEGHFDKTYNEVRQAMSKGVIPVIDSGNTSGEFELLVKYNDDDLVITGISLEDTIHVYLKASSGDDYLNFYEYPPG